MIRTQIQLTEEQARELRRLALERGISMAALVREAVERLVSDSGSQTRWERAFSAVGKFSDKEGASDVSEHHDRYGEDAYLDWRR